MPSLPRTLADREAVVAGLEAVLGRREGAGMIYGDELVLVEMKKRWTGEYSISGQKYGYKIIGDPLGGSPCVDSGNGFIYPSSA